METRIGLIGELSGPEGTIDLSGSADSVFKLSGDRRKVGIYPELTRNPTNYGYGGMAFSGVTGGVSWGKIRECKGSNQQPE